MKAHVTVQFWVEVEDLEEAREIGDTAADVAVECHPAAFYSYSREPAVVVQVEPFPNR